MDAVNVWNMYMYLCCCFKVDTKVHVLLSSSVMLNNFVSWLFTLEHKWALMAFIFSTWSIKVFFSRIRSFNFMKVFDTLRTIRVPVLVVTSRKQVSDSKSTSSFSDTAFRTASTMMSWPSLSFGWSSSRAAASEPYHDLSKIELFSAYVVVKLNS